MLGRSTAGMNRSVNSDTSSTTPVPSSRSAACDHPRAGKQRFQSAPQRAPLLGFFLVLRNIRRFFPRSTDRAAQLLRRSRSRSSHSVRSLPANHFDAHVGTADLSDSAMQTSDSVILSEAEDLCHPRNFHCSTRDGTPGHRVPRNYYIDKYRCNAVWPVSYIDNSQYIKIDGYQYTKPTYPSPPRAAPPAPGPPTPPAHSAR